MGHRVGEIFTEMQQVHFVVTARGNAMAAHPLDTGGARNDGGLATRR